MSSEVESETTPEVQKKIVFEWHTEGMPKDKGAAIYWTKEFFDLAANSSEIFYERMTKEFLRAGVDELLKETEDDREQAH